MTPEQLAINTVSLRNDDFESLLDGCAGAGFKKVEFVLPQAKAWMADNNADVAALKALLERKGLTCIGGFECEAKCFGSDDELAQNLALFQTNADIVNALGGGTIVLGTNGPGEGFTGDPIQTIGQRLAAMADALPESVRLAVEFNWSPVVKSLRTAALVCEAANHPRVGILFDPAHYHCTPSKLSDLTQATVARIFHVHVDDMADKPGDQSNCNADRRLPGQGCLDLTEIFGRIESFGYTGDFSIEMFSDELWALPANEAATQMHRSMTSLCQASA